MFESVGTAVYRPLCATSARRRPGHVGAAVALGIACGLLLTKSLLGPMLLLAIYFMPVHLPIALLTAIAVATLSGLVDPIAGLLGIWSMKITPVQHWVGGLQAYPLGAWLRLNNSVAHGYLLIALGQLLPSFLIIRSCARWIRAQDEFAANGLLRGDPDRRQELVPAVSFLPASATEEHESEQAETTREAAACDAAAKSASELQTISKIALDGSQLMATDNADPINALEAHLRSDAAGPLSTQEVANRASELASLVGDILSSIQSAADAPAGEMLNSSPSIADSRSESRDDYRAEDTNLQNEVEQMQNETQTMTQPENLNSSAASEISHNHEAHSSPTSTPQAAVSSSLPEVARHEEALRYLLHHLKEIQEKV